MVNRVHPEQEVAGPRGVGGDALAPWWRNLDELAALAAAERRTLAPLTDRVTDAPVVLVPLLPTDVHDLDGLAQVATHLFA